MPEVVPVTMSRVSLVSLVLQSVTMCRVTLVLQSVTMCRVTLVLQSDILVVDVTAGGDIVQQ